MSTIISLDDFFANNSTESLWLCIEGAIYDVTHFLNMHPGGGRFLKRLYFIEFC